MRVNLSLQLTELLDQLERVIDHSLQKNEQQDSMDILNQFKVIDDALAQLRATKTPIPVAMQQIHEDLQRRAEGAAATADALASAHKRLRGLIDKTGNLAGAALSRNEPRQVEPSRNGSRKSKSGGMKIPQLMDEIVDALHFLGGTATRGDVFARLEDRLQYDFTPEDTEIVPGGLSRWKTRSTQARRNLIRKGELEDCQGIWALTKF